MYYSIEGSNVRLAGSMHLVPQAATLPRWVVDAFDWCEELYFEHDSSDLRNYAMLAPGESNLGKFSPELTQKLRALWPLSHPWAGALGAQKLWFISMLTGSAGVPLLLGVEHYIQQQNKAAGRPVHYLETLSDFSIRFDAVPDSQMLEALSIATHQSAELRAKRVALLYEAWISGKADEVMAVLLGSPLFQFAEIRRAALDDRNAAWMPKIEQAMRREKRTAVFVGAGHVGGENGLLALLKRSGRSVTPIVNHPL